MAGAVKNFVQGLAGVQANSTVQNCIDRANVLVAFSRDLAIKEKARERDLAGAGFDYVPMHAEITNGTPEYAIHLLIRTARRYPNSRNLLYRAAARIADKYDVDINSLDKRWDYSKVERQLRKLRRE
jgi:hypothetical protein